LFVIPAALDSAEATPAQHAQAITNSWRPGPATEALRPLLMELLRLHKFDPQQLVSEQELPESVYVMF
jgi:hypothetical protein